MTPDSSECLVPVPSEAQRNWKCLCYLCFPDAVEYGELVPDLWLFKNGDTYGLMSQPGHNGDYLLLFPEKPTPDPDPECEHEGDEIAAASDVWIDLISDWQEKLKLFPHEGYMLTKSCYEAGWSTRHGHMLFWLFDRAGKMLEGKDVGTEQGNAVLRNQSTEDSDQRAVGEVECYMDGPQGAD